ncbi:MAG: hypothetical protein SFZ23_02135 [Planctomycetota bacterium]|nr:hypothetical protein [Planctomycetota bacterium]
MDALEPSQSTLASLVVPTVVLRHDLPGGKWHYDWMIQRPGGPDATLLSFRLEDRIDRLRWADIIAESTPDHRAAYLTHEGQVAGDRGVVVRLARGEAIFRDASPDRLTIDLAWPARPDAEQVPLRWQRVMGQPLGDGKWILRVRELADSPTPGMSDDAL